MLFDLFSGFDDHNQVLFDLSFLMWGVVMCCVISLFSFFWGSWVFLYGVYAVASKVVEGLTSRSLGGSIGGSVGFFRGMIFFLVFCNLFGLVPHVFSVTRHLSINLSLALPVWLGVVLMGVTYDLGGFLAHLQPLGSPAALNPFLCLIELVRMLVRPLTLSVRLTANLRTGHILFALLGSGFRAGGFIVIGLVLFVGVFYSMFEMGVCLVQSYIFTLLPVLYSDDHPSDH